MQTLFFPEYIKSNIFLHDLHHEISDHDINFDLLISDINYTDCPILSITPESKPNNVSLIDAWDDAIIASKHPLIILNELWTNFLSPILEKRRNSNQDLTIINLSTWMWSLWKKIQAEFNDLDNLPTNFNIFEPIDLENLRTILKKNWLNYIRLPYRELPDAIFDVDELWIIDASMLENLDSISLKTYGFSWNNATIFASGSLFSLALQTGEILKEKWKDISMFIFQRLNTERNNEMIESIKKSQNLYILIDHNETNHLRSWIENWLKQYDLNNIKLNFLTPKYENLTTIFDTYQDEQSDFSPEKLSERI